MEFKYCPYCGIKLTDVFAFCPQCGEHFKIDNAVNFDVVVTESDVEKVLLIKNGVVLGVKRPDKGWNLVIPKGVTKIKDYAFSGFNLLESVVIPNSVTTIG